MEEKYKFFIRENEWKWDLLVLLVKIWKFIYVYNIKKSPQSYLRRRVFARVTTSVRFLLARGNLGRYV